MAGNLTGQQDYYRSGSIQARAQELNDLIHQDELDVLMAAIGGMNTNAVLPYLDYAYLNQHPKTVVGYSDTTALLSAVLQKAPNCRVIYGSGSGGVIWRMGAVCHLNVARFIGVVDACGRDFTSAPLLE
nr:LD-carboxypeptidase [Bombilactobacillus folatiphilus]